MAKRPSLAESMKAVQQPAVRTVPVAVEPATAPARAVAEDRAGEARPYFAATRTGMKRVTAVVSPEDHRKIKRLSADTGLSIEELMRDAISGLFAKHGV